ncbi:MAG: hypothetical protein IKA31_03235 [Clostridia bacterium]|nr:hypothetical protein [Clostridia bacterium]
MSRVYELLLLNEKKEEKDKIYRERQKQYHIICKQERELVLSEFEKRTNEKIKYVPVNDMAVVPMVSLEDLMEILQELKENPPKHKKFWF